MRILFVSTSYPQDASDWRGVFMRHLVYALARSEEVTLNVWAPPGELPTQAGTVATPDEARWLAKLMADGGIAHRIRNGGIDALWRPLQLLRILRRVYRREHDVDVYHINWLQTALPLSNNNVPAIITVLGTDLKLLKAWPMKPLLRRVMRHRRVILCPNAEWMCETLEAAFGDVAQVLPVALGVDPLLYRVERELDAASPCWLAITRLTRDKLGPLFEWSAPLFQGSARRLHLFGPLQEDIRVPNWVHYHGAATAEHLSGEWFGRAHGLITLSQHAEGRPQVMLETMAAGLPIIASDVPAHAGLVKQGVTGVLCSDPKGYADALSRLEDTETNIRCGEAARALINLEVGTWDDCAERFVRLYRRSMVN